MLINIRGTNGSGKSQAIRTILDCFAIKSLYGSLGPRKPEAYEVTIPGQRKLYILGPYLTPTGGADCIQPYELILDLIEKYAEKGDVLFEGILISKSKGSVGQLLEKWGKQAVLIFLDTPMDVCIAAVQARRNTRGDGRPFNTKNLVGAFKRCVRVRKTLLAENKLRILDCSREKIVDLILNLLKGAK